MVIRGLYAIYSPGFPAILSPRLKNQTIRFFSYSADELLYLSEREKNVVTSLIQNIAAELRSPIDGLSQDVVISQIELLLTYSNRFTNVSSPE